MRSLHTHFLSLLVMCAAVPSLVACPPAGGKKTVPGRLAGALSVSDSGGAVYTVPLTLPPGIGNAVPQLALLYSSQAGDGLLGTGWMLQGLSTISRCARNAALDGEIRGIDYTGDDAYCLDGERLVSIGGNQYRTVNENFVRVEAFGISATGPEHFIVTLPNGIRREYGATADSRIEAVGVTGQPTPARVFAANKVMDLSGNYYTVSYEEDSTSGEFRPATIEYTANDAANQVAQRKVEFKYEERPIRDVLAYERYLGGAKTTTTMRLDSIQTRVLVGANWKPVLRYELTYEPNLTERGRSRLEKIEECAGSSCKAATTFEWADGTAGIDGIEDADSPTGYSTQPGDYLTPLFNHNFFGYDPLPGDYDGDGVTDLYMITDTSRSSGEQYFCSGRSMVGSNPSCARITSPTNWATDYDIYPGDFDGDGVTEHLWISTSSGTASICEPKLNIAESWDCEAALPSGWSSTHEVNLGDYDGDGRTDVLFVWDDTQRFCSGSGYQEGTPCVDWSNETDWATSWVQYSGDYDGDGRTDLWTVTTDSVTFCGGGFISGTSTDVCTTYAAPENWRDDYNVYPGDFNGDGHDDFYLVGETQTKFCPGPGIATGDNCVVTSQGINYKGGHRMYTGDFNGDGITDMGRVDSAGIDFCGGPYVSASFADCIRVINQTGLLEPEVGLIPGDFDGDGAPDFLVLEPEPILTPVCTQQQFTNTYNYNNPAFSWSANGRDYSATASVPVTYQLQGLINNQCRYNSTLNSFSQVLPEAPISFNSHQKGCTDGSAQTGWAVFCDYNRNGTKDTWEDPLDYSNTVQLSGANGSSWSYTYEASIWADQDGLGYSCCSCDYGSISCSYNGTRPASPPLPVNFPHTINAPPTIRNDSYVKVNLARGRSGAVDVIEKINIGIETDGTGMELSIAYAPITNMGTGGEIVYTKGTDAAYPLRDVQNPLFVVEEVTLPDGTGSKGAPGTYRDEYKYTGLRSDVDCRQSLGFESIEVISTRSWLRTVRELEQAAPLAGRVKRVRVYDTNQTGDRNDDTLLSDTETTWTLLPSDSSCTACQHAAAETVVSRTFELDGAPVATTTTTSSGFDNYGNPAFVDIAIDDDVSQTTSVYTHQTWTVYENDTSVWTLGQPTDGIITADGPFGGAEAHAFRVRYDASRRVRRKVDYLGDATAQRVTVLERDDPRGLVTKTTESVNDSGSPNRVSIMTYDSYGFVDRVKRELDDGLLIVTNIDLDPAFGQVSRNVDPNGVITEYSYDKFGRRTQQARAGGTITNVTYDDCDEGCPIPTARLKTTTEVSGTVPVISYFDSLDRAVGAESSDVAGHRLMGFATYDSLGRPAAESFRYFAGTNPLETETGATPPQIVTSYDALDRPKAITTPGPGDRTTAYEYAPLQATEIPPTPAESGGPRQTITKRDAAGNVRQVVDALGKPTDYFYDGFNNLREMRDSEGTVTQIGYNSAGYRTFLNDPGMGQWQFTANGFGETIRAESIGSGRTIETTYDGLGRVRTRTESIGSDVETWTWSYDAAAHGLGKLGAVSNSDQSYQRVHTYDTFSRPQGATVVSSPPNAWGLPATTTSTVAIAYDEIGRVERETFPGMTAVYGYSSDGTVTTIHELGGALLWEALDRDATGRVTEARYGNALESIQTYNPSTGDLQGVLTGNGEIQDLSYTFNELGNLSARADYSGGRDVEESFGYDVLNRLIWSQIAGQDPLFNDYDVRGNVTCMRSTVQDNCAAGGGLQLLYDEPAKPHRVTSVAQAASASPNVNGTLGSFNADFDYDEDGNQTARDGIGIDRHVHYTAFNKPKTIALGDAGGPTTEYLYGPDQELVWRYHPEGAVPSITFTPFDGYDQWLSGTNLEHRVSLKTPDGTMVVYKTADDTAPFNPSKVEYAHPDHLGSVSVVTDSAGEVVEEYSYDAFGRHRDPDTGELVGAETDRMVSNRTTDAAFTGQRQEPGHNLYNYRARMYDPTIGRFLQPDPVIQAPFNSQNLNRYAYVMNNPLTYVDPTGNFWSARDDLLGRVASRKFGPGVVENGVFIPSYNPNVRIVIHNLGTNRCNPSSTLGCSYTITYLSRPSEPESAPTNHNPIHTTAEPTLVGSTQEEAQTNFSEFVSSIAENEGGHAALDFLDAFGDFGGGSADLVRGAAGVSVPFEAQFGGTTRLTVGAALRAEQDDYLSLLVKTQQIQDFVDAGVIEAAETGMRVHQGSYEIMGDIAGRFIPGKGAPDTLKTIVRVTKTTYDLLGFLRDPGYQTGLEAAVGASRWLGVPPQARYMTKQAGKQALPDDRTKVPLSFRLADPTGVLFPYEQ